MGESILHTKKRGHKKPKMKKILVISKERKKDGTSADTLPQCFLAPIVFLFFSMRLACSLVHSFPFFLRCVFAQFFSTLFPAPAADDDDAGCVCKQQEH